MPVSINCDAVANGLFVPDLTSGSRAKLLSWFAHAMCLAFCILVLWVFVTQTDLDPLYNIFFSGFELPPEEILPALKSFVPFARINASFSLNNWALPVPA
jgi:TRAP-type C4-dicarboxylate transport system permease small subunit